MNSGADEPQIEQWDVIPIDELVAWLLDTERSSLQSPFIIAVDGRSGSGKSTLANRLHNHYDKSTIVHTDDVAWHHSFFDWSELLIDGVLRPLRAGQTVDYRPPAWDRRERPGSIRVDESCELVIVEGVGASRLEAWPWLTASVWVQSDMAEAEHRGIARDGGTEEAKRFWMEWMKEENEFQKFQQPWLRASAIVNGTPAIHHDAEREVVAFRQKST